MNLSWTSTRRVLKIIGGFAYTNSNWSTFEWFRWKKTRVVYLCSLLTKVIIRMDLLIGRQSFFLDLVRADVKKSKLSVTVMVCSFGDCFIGTLILWGREHVIVNPVRHREKIIQPFITDLGRFRRDRSLAFGYQSSTMMLPHTRQETRDDGFKGVLASVSFLVGQSSHTSHSPDLSADLTSTFG